MGVGECSSKETPTAVQARIGGAKGVWYVDPLSDPRSDEKWIEIRPSQMKFKHDPLTFRDPLLRTLVRHTGNEKKTDFRIFARRRVATSAAILIVN